MFEILGLRVKHKIESQIRLEFTHLVLSSGDSYDLQVLLGQGHKHSAQAWTGSEEHHTLGTLVKNVLFETQSSQGVHVGIGTLPQVNLVIEDK